MSTQNICFPGEIRKVSTISGWKNGALSEPLCLLNLISLYIYCPSEKSLGPLTVH